MVTLFAPGEPHRDVLGAWSHGKLLWNWQHHMYVQIILDTLMSRRQNFKEKSQAKLKHFKYIWHLWQYLFHILEIKDRLLHLEGGVLWTRENRGNRDGQTPVIHKGAPEAKRSCFHFLVRFLQMFQAWRELSLRTSTGLTISGFSEKTVKKTIDTRSHSRLFWFKKVWVTSQEAGSF